MESRTAVVMIVWNRKKRLKEVVDTFQKHNGRDYDEHTIVTDNGSTDGTVDYLQKSPFDVICHPVNKGAQAARNAGYIRAIERGYEFILFIEDDFPCTGKVPIKILESFLDENKEIGYVRLNDKPYLSKNVATQQKVKYGEWFDYHGIRLRKSNYHFTSNPVVFRVDLVDEFLKCGSERSTMYGYQNLYKYQCQLDPPVFKTIRERKRKGWKS